MQLASAACAGEDSTVPDILYDESLNLRKHSPNSSHIAIFNRLKIGVCDELTVAVAEGMTARPLCGDNLLRRR